MFKIFLIFLFFYFSLFMVVVFKFSQPNNSLPPTKRTFLWPERPMSFIWLSSFCFYFISFPVVCSFYFYVLNVPNFYVFLVLLLYGSCFSYLIVECYLSASLEILYGRRWRQLNINFEFRSKSCQCSNWKGMSCLGVDEGL